MSSRQQIVDAVIACLQGITDLSGRVYRWLPPSTFVPASGLPAVVVKDRHSDSVEETIGHWNTSLSLEIVWMAAGGSVSAVEATLAIDTILQALFADPTFGGLAIRIEAEVHTDLIIERDGDLMAAAQTDITITYRTARGRN